MVDEFYEDLARAVAPFLDASKAELTEKRDLVAALAVPVASEKDAIFRAYLGLQSTKSVASRMREIGIRKSPTAWFSPEDISQIIKRSEDADPSIVRAARSIFGGNSLLVAKKFD